MFYLFLLLAVTCFVAGFKKRQAWLLTVPFFVMFLYVAVEIVRVPGSVVDTMKFIFSLD